MSTAKPPSVPPGPTSTTPAPRVIASETLFPHGQREVVIEHGGERYRLHQTRNGKLILTK